MFARRCELLEKMIHNGDDLLELSEVRFSGNRISSPKPCDLADELAAFANSRGGTLLLGVDGDTREVTGIPVHRLNMVEALVLQVCENAINPPFYPVIERLSLTDSHGINQPVMRVEMPSSMSVHQSSRGYFRRVGSSRRPLSTHELARLFQQRNTNGFIRFDQMPVYCATIADLDEALWKRFIAPRSVDEAEEQWMINLAIVRQGEDKVLRPTMAGILMACRQPQEFLRHAFIQAVAYRGKTSSSQIGEAYQRDARDITGPLDQQIHEFCYFVQRNMQVTAGKGTSGKNIPQFDMLAVFEAIVNAVAHRDYSMRGSQIRLYLFDDRLELYTPGPLVGTMTPESLGLRQVSRNDVITSLLANCPVEGGDFGRHRSRIMDRRGEGVNVILDRSEQLSGKVPEYRLLDDSELLLTIYAASTAGI